jgi:hypothetical protein
MNFHSTRMMARKMRAMAGTLGLVLGVHPQVVVA